MAFNWEWETLLVDPDQFEEPEMRIKVKEVGHEFSFGALLFRSNPFAIKPSEQVAWLTCGFSKRLKMIASPNLYVVPSALSVDEFFGHLADGKLADEVKRFFLPLKENSVLMHSDTIFDVNSYWLARSDEERATAERRKKEHGEILQKLLLSARRLFDHNSRQVAGSAGGSISISLAFKEYYYTFGKAVGAAFSGLNPLDSGQPESDFVLSYNDLRKAVEVLRIAGISRGECLSALNKWPFKDIPEALQFKSRAAN